jgi:CubicO group peptidase (beta-lactamase class C family)
VDHRLTRREAIARATVAVAGLALTGRIAGPAQAATSGLYYPPRTGAWKSITASEAGWDGDALDAALAFAGARRSTGVVVLVGGRMLAERYWRGATPASTRDVASVQKSLTSYIVGSLRAERKIALDDPVSRWLGAGWTRTGRANERAITVRHLLEMTSGLDDSFHRVAAPGKRWQYVNDAYHQLHPLLERASGTGLQRLSSRLLFGPIGATSARWRARFGRDPNGRPLLGLELTPRDLARFGLLALARGRWGRTVVVPEVYARRALASSQPLNPSYGFLWWLNGKSSHQLPGPAPRPVAGPLIPGAPADTVAALGAGDQKIYVVPSYDLVVVRQGFRASGAGELAFDEEWWRALSRALPRR